MLAEVFNQWRVYKNNYMKSKDYFYRIFLRLSKRVESRAFRKWKAELNNEVANDFSNEEN